MNSRGASLELHGSPVSCAVQQQRRSALTLIAASSVRVVPVSLLQFLVEHFFHVSIVTISPAGQRLYFQQL